MTAAKAPGVPAAMQTKYDAITALTDSFCAAHLGAQYAELSRRAVAALCRKRPSPLMSGQEKVWACAVVYAVGQVNHLDAKDATPHMRMADLCAHFGIGASTGGNKAKLIRDALGMQTFDPKWALPSRLVQKPMGSLIMINGVVVDARQLHVAVQKKAVELGLLPFVVHPAGKTTT